MTETDTAAEADVTKRGRPRPQNTIERDEHVYKTLLAHGAPATRNELAEKLDSMKSSHVYLSLIRLRRDGYVQRGSATGEVGGKSHTWEALTK